MINKYPYLEKDFLFKSQLGLNYWSDNPFKENQEIAKMTGRKETVTGLGALLNDDGKPFFSNAFLIEEYLGMSKQDIIANKEAKERKIKEKAEAAKKEGAGATGAAGEKKEGGEEPPQVTL